MPRKSIKSYYGIEKRFGETEDSVKAIASFVKKQTDKNREMIAGLKETLKPQKIDMSTYDNKIRLFEDTLEQVMKKIEKQAPAPDIENFKSKLTVLNDKINELDSKIAGFVAKKIDIRSKGITGDDKEISEKLQEQSRIVLAEFERRIRSLRSEFEREVESHLEKTLGDEAKIIREEFNRKLNELRTRLESSKDYEHFYDDLRKTNSKLFDIENQLKSLTTRKDLEEKLGSVQKTVSDLTTNEIREMNNRFSRMKNELDTFATKHDLDEIKKYLSEENKNKKIFEELENLRTRGDEQSTIHKSIDKRIQDVEREIESLKVAESAEEKADIRDMEDRIAGLRNLLKDVSVKSSSMLQEARDVQEKLKTEMKARLSNVATKDEVARIREAENKLRNKFIMEFATKADLEEMRKSYKGIDNSIMRDIADIKAINEEQDMMHNSIEKRLQDLEKQIQTSYAAETAEEKADMRNVSGRVGQLSRLVDEERSKRAAMVNHMHELENQFSELRKERKKSLISKEVENQMSRTISKHLAEFSKVMDKRLPNVVTREQHIAFMKDIDKRLQAIETPDMRNILHRIEHLENQLNQINTMAKDVYNRIPVVVE